MKSLADLDDWLVLAVNYPAGRSPLLDKIVFDLADSTLLKGGLFLAFYWWLWFRGDARGESTHAPDDRRAVVVALVGGTIAAVVSRLLQVGLPFHQRPLHTPSLPLRLPVGVDAEMLNTFSSFPSDHAVLFFALCVPMWTLSRWLGVAAGLWTLFVICLPRVYLGYHYPSDVLAGGALGAASALLLWEVRPLKSRIDALSDWLGGYWDRALARGAELVLSLIHISEPTRPY